jgi:hypothetical protein
VCLTKAADNEICHWDLFVLFFTVFVLSVSASLTVMDQAAGYWQVCCAESLFAQAVTTIITGANTCSMSMQTKVSVRPSHLASRSQI